MKANPIDGQESPNFYGLALVIKLPNLKNAEHWIPFKLLGIDSSVYTPAIELYNFTLKSNSQGECEELLVSPEDLAVSKIRIPLFHILCFL